jgi:cytochrome c oxidase subunit II
MRRRAGRPSVRLLPILAVTALAGCAGPQRMLDTRGPAAEQIAALWWLVLGLAVITSIVIPALLLLAVSRGRRRAAGADVGEVDGRRLVWIGGAIVPALLLLTTLVASYRLSREIYPPRPAPADALTIDVIAHMFWWQVRYADHDIVTANEFVIPVGRPVRLRLTSGDVIHSFWVPQLHGKMDHIPGRTNELWLRADTAGEFRGQCAEYCGMAHALMALWLRAVEPHEFDAWLERRVQPRPPPTDALAVEGRRVFEAAGCGQCHATPGAPLPPRLAGAGPDLADFGARRSIAAGRLPNTPANLAAWIADPQRLKPGNRMPGTAMPDEQMHALVAYLYTLN